MATVTWTNKDPADRADYSLYNWIAHVGAAVASASWSVSPSGLTLGASNVKPGGDETEIRTEGGAANTTYTVTCHVVLVNGQEFDRSARLFVTDR